jgi:hypothetical protein
MFEGTWMTMGAPFGPAHKDEVENRTSGETDSGNRRFASAITDAPITRKSKWLFVKVCEYNNPISTAS